MFKAMIKSRIHPLVWERLGQAKQEYKWTKRIMHCDDPLVPVFQKYLSYKHGFYVDVGSNDGRSCSNTYHLEKFQNWSGILVEPIMHIFFRSRQIRSIEANKFFNCALVGKDYKKDSVELLYSGMMSITKTSNQEYTPEEWAQVGSQFLSRGENVQRTWSQARTLESILLEADSPRLVDLLSIDVEGAEYGVLEGIDFENWIFKYILIETTENSRADTLLNSKGYKHIETIAQNILFAHPSMVTSK
jgi:FkbM family methyltransferase